VVIYVGTLSVRQNSAVFYGKQDRKKDRGQKIKEEKELQEEKETTRNGCF